MNEMADSNARRAEQRFTVREARPEDVPEIRALMLRIFESDFGYGYLPQYHWDYDDLVGTYLDNPRHVLYVAVDDASGEVVGMAGIRAGGPPRSPRVPGWLADRYDPARTAQLVRVYTDRAHRGRGIATTLVEYARRFVADENSYEILCLHSESAVEFWRAMPTVSVVYDERSDGTEAGSVHFEMAIPRP